ncbi:hypothetical protein GCM10010442_18090 [Kitasatospora kifunensis]
MLIGLGLAGVYIAVTQALRAVRGGPAEYFEVRERGLIHGFRRGPTVFAWDRVTAITIRTAERDTALGRQLGIGYRCVLRSADGRRPTGPGGRTGRRARCVGPRGAEPMPARVPAHR